MHGRIMTPSLLLPSGFLVSHTKRSDNAPGLCISEITVLTINFHSSPDIFISHADSRILKFHDQQIVVHSSYTWHTTSFRLHVLIHFQSHQSSIQTVQHHPISHFMISHFMHKMLFCISGNPCGYSQWLQDACRLSPVFLL